MSTRKARRLQICEPVPGLRILVQLSNTPLVRTVIATVTHHQLAIVGVVFFVTLVFAMRENDPWLTVPKQVAIEFFSAVSQS
ncbi:hypothetical protein, partial [Nostoc sp.]|uniref:hypothetical protein n=1 Tax=Nostoc sp. TaxID=1180 RepID=UPI002FF922F5